MPIMETVATAMQAYEAAKAVVTVASEAKRAVDTADIKLKLAEAKGALADVMTDAISMQARIDELEKLVALRGRVHYCEPSYWETRADGSEDGPYCQPCWDTGGKLIRLQTTGFYQRLKCHACKAEFAGPRTAAIVAAENAEARTNDSSHYNPDDG